jgi:hypothetical protein
MRTALVVASMVLAASAAAPMAAQEVHVKKAIADRMTPEELRAYEARLRSRILQREEAGQGFRAGALAPADACPGATHEISGLPYGPVADTTVGQTDDYNLPTDTSDPTCTAPASCTGAGPAGSLPRGAIYTGTGTAPDRAYRLRTSADCTLTITMDPTGAQDLSLIVYQAACSNLLSDCACVDDTGVGGVAEQVTLNAVAGTDYYVVIDGYSTGAAPPGPSGPFTLTVAGSGCALVPIELQAIGVR